MGIDSFFPTIEVGGPAADPHMDRLSVDTLRTLAIDAVQQANSGHPGTPMALAPVAYTLWRDFLRYDPSMPDWPNRDRFVLSVGHASMLLYGLLHLAGVVEIDADGQRTGNPAVSLQDIREFRQLDSKTPGHPEYRMTTGVETTTGPLGQGCANSVGMAIASRWLAQHFNRGAEVLFDYDVYVLCGDGDLMEGIAYEAASLAGHLRLSNLCWIYDNNSVSIEGSTELAFSEDVAARFRSQGWHVLTVPDANDVAALADALASFKGTHDQPTLIVVDSIIGYGAPNRQNTASAHGEPLGEEEARLAKKAYGWPEDARFLVPEGVGQHLHGIMRDRAWNMVERWKQSLDKLRAQDPALAAQLDHMRCGTMPEGWLDAMPSFAAEGKGMATRDAGGKVLNAFAAHVPWLLGGSADLAPSTKTRLTFEGAGRLSATNPGGRNVHFGIREHAMGAVANGMALCYLRPYTSTFLVFSDYMKPPMRLAAIMELPVVFVYTHDSIGVGEDGPTHQPIEHLAQLRGIPGLITMRPADANETAVAWRSALSQSHRPTCLVLSRQPLPTLDRNDLAPADGVARGGYVLARSKGAMPEVILIGSGSEVGLCVEVWRQLQADGIDAGVVSMPSWELFEMQDPAYREEVLPASVTARVAVEQGSGLGWERYVGMTGAKLVMQTFGASAPIGKLQAKFGFTVENLYRLAKAQVGNRDNS